MSTSLTQKNRIDLQNLPKRDHQWNFGCYYIRLITFSNQFYMLNLKNLLSASKKQHDIENFEERCVSQNIDILGVFRVFDQLKAFAMVKK